MILPACSVPLTCIWVDGVVRNNYSMSFGDRARHLPEIPTSNVVCRNVHSVMSGLGSSGVSRSVVLTVVDTLGVVGVIVASALFFTICGPVFFLARTTMDWF